jgi:hypothetical protein
LGRTAWPARATATKPFRARGLALHLRLQLPLHLRLRLPLLLRPIARQVRLALTESLSARQFAVGLLALQLPLLLRPAGWRIRLDLPALTEALGARRLAVGLLALLLPLLLRPIAWQIRLVRLALTEALAARQVAVGLLTLQLPLLLRPVARQIRPVRLALAKALSRRLRLRVAASLSALRWRVCRSARRIFAQTALLVAAQWPRLRNLAGGSDLLLGFAQLLAEIRTPAAKLFRAH